MQYSIVYLFFLHFYLSKFMINTCQYLFDTSILHLVLGVGHFIYVTEYVSQRNEILIRHIENFNSKPDFRSIFSELTILMFAKLFDCSNYTEHFILFCN